ncbi:MAG: DUF1016 family protein [Bacteroidetes bacterium]|jgi:predicted nuclease of restriction endonuclease-like (RecB) superfamily|nr:DUF1016 family protein [Bacteroidota bacterium]MBT6685491.1 DUF1016 family protein [Bacteroidota bacterium]MBT7144598.1 DUF1016 family protein [Bacteroidota bacterium]MBT7493488.1 DUF1016 family protein [Bacteroidota bacterium]
MNLKHLANQISEMHNELFQKAVSAVNTALTVRNWWIGAYIVEYEQNGEDRAAYGTGLIPHLAKEIEIKGLSETNLRVCRQFYILYPHIFSILQEIKEYFPIHQLPTDELLNPDNKRLEIHQSLTDELATVENIANRIHQSATDELKVPAKKIIKRLSFTHLTELIKIENSLKRTFYEIECINGTWSVKELKRQIATLYFERSGLSKDKEKLSRLVHQNAEQLTPAHILKTPLTFEFLDLPVKSILEESDIEQALMDNLQMFLLELGNGFCFEARQKRILIDDEYFYIDLVFYHRILRSHVIIEIKNDEFKHEHIGQLEVYLQYYKYEEMKQYDNQPIGILLCTKSKKAMVKYATTAKENVFVNEYLINLPSKSELEKIVKKWMKNN